MQKLTTFLSFQDRAEEAVEFYVSIFPDSSIGRILRWGNVGHGTPGEVLTIEFQLAGQSYVAMNGGSYFKMTDAISISIDCKDQEEIDFYAEKLTSAGGEQRDCGWVLDRFGLSWQVVPKHLADMTTDPDQAKADRVFAAMLKMKKLDVAELERAYRGEG